MSKRPVPGRLKGLGYRNCVLRRGELLTLHRTHYRNIACPGVEVRWELAGSASFITRRYVLESGTKELWECFHQKLQRIKKESSIVDNLEMGLDWRN